MLVQKYREYYIANEKGVFIIGKSKEEVYAELKTYCDSNKDKAVFVYEHPVRPNKQNYLPEYALEVTKFDKTAIPLVFFSRRVQ